MRPVTLTDARKPLVILAWFLVLGMVLSVIDRTDANWDLQNYHLYAPYAALHGRLGMDWFAGGFQGYLNPTEDIPYYLVKMVLFPNHPVVVAALAGLPFGFLGFVTFGIARVVLPGWGIALLATVLGLTGATTLSEVGTTYDDILIADFVLVAVWIFLAEPCDAARAAAAGGLFLGCAVGLKLTAVLYVPGLMLLAVLKKPWPLQKHLILISGFSALGFLSVWGWWGWQLWMHFGNPFFPMLGALFPKTAIPGMSFHDPRFMPRNLMQWWFYPFYWIEGRSFVVSEEPLRDPRFAFVYVAIAIRLTAFSHNSDARLPPKAAALMVFFVLTYCCWLIGFSILRYALALEAISGIVIFAALSGLVDRRTYFAMIGAVTIFTLAFTKPMGWGRIGYAKSFVSGPVPTIQSKAVVLMAGGPIGFVLPYLQSSSSVFLALDLTKPGTKPFDIAQQRLAAGDDAELLTDLNDTKMASVSLTLILLGRMFNAKDCVPIQSAVQKNIRLCQLQVLR